MPCLSLKMTVGKISGIVVLSIMLVANSVHGCLADDPDPGQLLVSAIHRYKSVESYTCRLDKRVANAGTLHEDLSITVKFKKPTNYYFRWEKGLRRGREVIFDPGRHNGKIVAHPGGLFRFMVLHLNPEGRLAMKENRHSLKNSGLGKIMQVVEADYRRSRLQGLDAIGFVGKGRIDDRSTWVIQGQFPENQGYYASKVVLFLDQSLGLPIKASIYDGSGRLVEEYVFHQLAINVGLTDQDFDPDNPDYDFF